MADIVVGGDGILSQDDRVIAQVRYAFEVIPGRAETVGELTLQEVNDFDPKNLQGLSLRLVDGRALRITVEPTSSILSYLFRTADPVT